MFFFWISFLLVSADSWRYEVREEEEEEEGAEKSPERSHQTWRAQEEGRSVKNEIIKAEMGQNSMLFLKNSKNLKNLKKTPKTTQKKK